MSQVLHRQTGTGPVAIGSVQLYATWEYCHDEDDAGRPTSRRWTIRLSIDEAESLGLQPYQWVHLQLPGRPATRAFYHGGRDAPPFVLLTFER